MMNYTNLMNQYLGVQVELAEAKGMIAALSAKIEEKENDGKHAGTKNGTTEPVRADGKPDRNRKAKTA